MAEEPEMVACAINLSIHVDGRNPSEISRVHAALAAFGRDYAADGYDTYLSASNFVVAEEDVADLEAASQGMEVNKL